MAQLELKIGDKAYNKAWVDNLSSTSQISSDPASVNYSVIPSTGNATMRDINGQIKADVENGVLPASNVPTKISINGNQIQEHTTSDSDYDIIDKNFSVQFSDRLSLLDKVTYGGMPLREYSMTAYDMLDDVIGSYGGYCRERVFNWTKYQHGNSIKTMPYNKITVTTGSGWEIIGAPIKIIPNIKHTISYSIRTGTEYTTLDGTNGIALQVLSSIPTDTNCSDISLATTHLAQTASTSNIGTVEFTPTTDTVYLILNFGWASADQTISVTVNSIRVDGKSLSLATTKSCYRSHSVKKVEPYLDVETQTVADRLSRINIEFPYLPQASYRETIEKFCNLGQLTMALDEDGAIQFYDTRPYYANEKITNVPDSYKISNLNKTVFLKNKIDGVEIKQDSPIESIETSVPITTVEVTPNDYLTNSNNANNSKTQDNRYVAMETYYTTFDVKIPERSLQQNQIIRGIETGVNEKGNKTVYYEVSWKYQFYESEFRMDSQWHDTLLYETTGAGDITQIEFPTNGDETLSDAYGIPNPFAGFVYDDNLNKKVAGFDIQYTYILSGERKIVATNCIDISNTLTGNIFQQDDDKNFVATINLVVGKKATIGAGSTSSTLRYYGVFIPISAKVQFSGVVYNLNFQEVDASSANIENATTTVSVPTSEVMQNLSNVTSIRNNILSDYANGVPTATIDLFCGLGDWKNGEIIKVNDALTFDDDLDKNGAKNLWKVTGRTFKYQDAPTLSLELQSIRGWKTSFNWGGSAKKDNIRDANGGGNGTGTIDLPVKIEDVKNTLIVAQITYIINGNERYSHTAGMRSASDSVLLIGTAQRISCSIKISDDGTKVDYSAGYLQHKVGLITYTGYVKSIEITQLTTAKFY